MQQSRRDRAGPYADAARTGAPGAIQAADRWHLLVNASDALRHVVERHQPQLRDAMRVCAAPASPASHPRAPLPIPGAAPAVSPPSHHARFEVVQRLPAERVPIKQIVRRTGVARNAVRRWLRAGEFIPYRRAPASSPLNGHQPFQEERWLAGERRSIDLHRALQARGFEGGYDIVRRWAARRRADAAAAAQVLPSQIPSARPTTRLLTVEPSLLNQAERRFVEALEKAAPDLRIAADLVRDFGSLLKHDDPAGLDPWLTAAAKTGLRGFAHGVRQDQAAVEAAIAQPWGNGQVEGQNNRLKLIKRSMYGRAGLDPLRQRVLQAA